MNEAREAVLAKTRKLWQAIDPQLTISAPPILELTLGPDGKLWATDESGSRIISIVP